MYPRIQHYNHSTLKVNIFISSFLDVAKIYCVLAKVDILISFRAKADLINYAGAIITKAKEEKLEPNPAVPRHSESED
jgi:hypothetical protein